MAEMSPLRRRMIEDMTIRNLSPATAPANLTPTASDPRPERPTPTRHRAFPIAPNDPRLRSIRLM